MAPTRLSRGSRPRPRSQGDLPEGVVSCLVFLEHDTKSHSVNLQRCVRTVPLQDILLGDSANLGDLLRDVGGPDECLGVAVRIPADIAHAGRNGVSKAAAGRASMV